ncbi:DUF2934 domain-containing protein [Terrihabitans sp. B22-R8]|uniref:DUF2934 domain-containing protein n=1 Tax=Terrihabitans sp. B22-R8 TaxID=3425128 RepID=UPI00403C6EFC
MDKDELIRLRAYEIWIQEGQPEGREREHWLQARREILGDGAPEEGSFEPRAAGRPDRR